MSTHVSTGSSKSITSPGEQASRAHYLKDVVDALRVPWPDNRTITVVCHGHSIPAGYFRTPRVQTFDSYPYLLHVALKDQFPNAILNVIVSAVGGEDSECGAERFERDVVSLHPDVVTIDYALNDRRIGLQRAESAHRKMIELAEQAGARVILLTPSLDMDVCTDDLADPTIHSHADLIEMLAGQYRVGLADSYGAFQTYCRNGGKLSELMSQPNHPNRIGHRLIARELFNCFY